MTGTEEKPKSDAVLIKEYFGMDAKTALAELKELGKEAKEQIGEGIRNGTLTY